MPLGIKAWRGRKQDWIEEKWGWDTVTRAYPMGALELEWPFRVVLSWGKGT